MLRTLLFAAIGAVLALLGLIGLVLPVVPGLLLLVAAALCFSAVSPRLHGAVHARVRRHPRLRLLHWRWQAGRHLPPGRRLALAFWLGLAVLLPPRRA